MISSFSCPISKLGLLLSGLIASDSGRVVFARGLPLNAMSEKKSHSTLPLRHNDGSPKSLAGIGAALLLLVFISSEALATVLALRH